MVYAEPLWADERKKWQAPGKYMEAVAMKKQYSFFHYFPKTRDEKIITLTAKKQRNLEALHAEFGKILYGNCPDKNPVFENTLYFG